LQPRSAIRVATRESRRRERARATKALDETPNPTPWAPIVFISYSHEGKGHRERVLRLAEWLRKDAGFESRLDQYDDHLVSNWPKWMRKQIVDADYVVIVFTKTYRREFDGDEAKEAGHGVKWKGAIITNLLYATVASEELKFIPVVFGKPDLDQVPRDLFAGSIYVLNSDENEWGSLNNRLWKKPSAQPPPVGRAPTADAAQTADDRDSQAGSNTAPRRTFPASHTLTVLFVGAQKGTNLDLREQLRLTKKAIARAKFGQSLNMIGEFDITLMSCSRISADSRPTCCTCPVSRKAASSKCTTNTENWRRFLRTCWLTSWRTTGHPSSW
jgi:hypothetical protein